MEPKSVMSLTHDDISKSLAKWNRSLGGVVMGRIPFFTIMYNFVDKNWAQFGKIDVILLKNGFYIFLFENEELKVVVLKQGLWFFSINFYI